MEKGCRYLALPLESLHFSLSDKKEHISNIPKAFGMKVNIMTIRCCRVLGHVEKAWCESLYLGSVLLMGPQKSLPNNNVTNMQ